MTVARHIQSGSTSLTAKNTAGDSVRVDVPNDSTDSVTAAWATVVGASGFMPQSFAPSVYHYDGTDPDAITGVTFKNQTTNTINVITNITYVQ